MTDAVAYHESLAAGWSGRYASGGMRRRAAFFRDEVLPKLKPSGAWLDVGCGSGVFSRMLAGAGADVLGLDGSQGMVEAARRDAGPGLRFETGRVEDVAALPGTFDGAICLSVLEYVSEPERALTGIASRLKPGGRLAVSLPNRGSTLRRAQRGLKPFTSRDSNLAYMDSSQHLWSRAEAARLAAGAACEVEALIGFDPVAPRWAWPLISPSLWFLIARRA